MAILLSTAAALLPIVIEIFENEIVKDGTRLWWGSPAWSSVLLIVAFALVLLDRFYGFSSAWMRFLSAVFQIREILDAFRIDWQIGRAGWKDGKPTEQQIQEGLRACRVFLGQVDAILKSELDAWVQEFRSALSDIDEAVKARAETAKVAAANITVENGKQCSEGWTLVVDGGAPRLHHGQTATITNLPPGLHSVQVTGKIGAKSVLAAKTFAAAAGSVADVSLKLD